MARAAMLATLALLAFAAGVSATDSACGTKCMYVYGSGPCGPGSITYTFDLEPLCGKQLVATDGVGHTYHTSICANTDQNCLPATWKNTYESGVSIQMWGATPACTSPPACTDSAGDAKCCTADCQVLGVLPAAKWGVVDPENPGTGGVWVRYTGAAASDSDPFWCSFNPATGAQYERQVTHIFQCAPEVETVEVVGASQNTTNDCSYTITFASRYACAQLSTLVTVPGAHPELSAGMPQPAAPSSLFASPAGIAGLILVCVAAGLASGVVAYRVMSLRRRSSGDESGGVGSATGVQLLP